MGLKSVVLKVCLQSYHKKYARKCILLADFKNICVTLFASLYMSTYFWFFQNDLKVIQSSWELKLYFSSKLFQSSKSNLSINTVSMHSRFTVSLFAYVKSYRLPRSVQPVRLPSSINILTPLSGFECVCVLGNVSHCVMDCLVHS